MNITYSIETNEEYYTNEESDARYIPELTKTIEAKATEWMKKNYPNVEFETQLVPETMSISNQSRANEDDWDSTEAHEILESLTDYIANNWCEWWPEQSA